MPVGVSAYVPLANVTLSSSAASVTFSSISQAYRDLVLVCKVNPDTSGRTVKMRFNNDSAGNYSFVSMYGDGASPGSQAFSGNDANYLFYTVNAETNSLGIANILDYSTTDKHKTTLVRGNAPTDWGTIALANRWANTAAVTSITLLLNANSFQAGSTFALYGVSA